MRLSWRTGIVLATCCLAIGAEYAAAADKKERWDNSLSLGFNLTSGNSDTLLFTLGVRAEREWPRDALRLGADAAFGETEGDTTTERAGAFIEYSRLFNERFFGTLKASLFHDSIADVEYRLTIGPTLGYYFIKTDITRLSGEIGPSYVREKLGREVDDFMALRIGERFEHQLSKTSKLWQSVEFLPQVNDFENFLVTAELGAEAALNSRLSLRVVFQDKYDNEPAEGKKRNDIAVISSLVYKF